MDRPVSSLPTTQLVPTQSRTRPHFCQGYAALFKGQFTSTVLEPMMLIFTLGMPIVMYLMFGAFNSYSNINIGHANVAAQVMLSMGFFGGFMAAACMGAQVGVERGSGWDRQLALTPVSAFTNFLVKITQALVSVLMSLILLCILGAAFNARAQWYIWIVVPLIAVLLSSIPAAIGIAVGYWVRGDAAYSLIGGASSIFAFLAGLFIPLEQLAKFFRDLAPYTPLYGISRLGLLPLYSNSLVTNEYAYVQFSWKWVANIAAWAVIAAIFALWGMKRARRR